MVTNRAADGFSESFSIFATKLATDTGGNEMKIERKREDLYLGVLGRKMLPPPFPPKPASLGRFVQMSRSRFDLPRDISSRSQCHDNFY